MVHEYTRDLQIPLRTSDRDPVRKQVYFDFLRTQFTKNLESETFPPKAYRKNLVSIVPANSEIIIGGTGIILNEGGFVLTALHLVQCFQRKRELVSQYRMKREDAIQYAIDPSFFAWDEEHDLAILRAMEEIRYIDPIKIASREPIENEDLLYYSFPNGGRIVETRGRVKTPSEDVYLSSSGQEKRRKDSLVFSGRADFGYSGSPIFTSDGLLAVLFGGDAQENILATKSSYVRTLIECARDSLY